MVKIFHINLILTLLISKKKKNIELFLYNNLNNIYGLKKNVVITIRNLPSTLEINCRFNLRLYLTNIQLNVTV